MADLLRDPAVEQQLRAEGHIGDAPVLGWIWKPFAEGKDDRLQQIADRVGLLLDISDVDDIPADITAIDPRLCIPLVLLRCGRDRQPIVLTTEEEREIEQLIDKVDARRRQLGLTSSHLSAAFKKQART